MPRSDHPLEIPFPGRQGRERAVVAADEGEEGVGPVRGIIMPGPVLPHPPALVSLFAVGPKPPQAQAAALLVEPAARKGGPRRRDCLPWAVLGTKGNHARLSTIPSGVEN